MTSGQFCTLAIFFSGQVTGYLAEAANVSHTKLNSHFTLRCWLIIHLIYLIWYDTFDITMIHLIIDRSDLWQLKQLVTILFLADGSLCFTKLCKILTITYGKENLCKTEIFNLNICPKTMIVCLSNFQEMIHVYLRDHVSGPTWRSKSVSKILAAQSRSNSTHNNSEWLKPCACLLS